MKQRHTILITVLQNQVSFVQMCPVSEVLPLPVLSLQITAATAQASIVKKALFNKAMKSKTKDLRRLAVSVVMVIDTG